ncbi:MAG: NAD(P)/FAD-dependent oxidoreductase [Gemmatimonas sp.]|jgi:glycine/D-amino acid oxidase-like deaminating enzyme|uniref:NAD(P)/FAD-dependent oxidoreductase n=1 Tax=Gemmatimonas sp. TaxID=1962908 RepID=UPI00391F6F5D|nr:FAD-binding oxidoreductase [Gemmatimonadota bacterium]
MHVAIVGGGVMGAATAWFLARAHGVRVTVLERDASYARASSALSACAIRQQFSTAINIRLSQDSLAFYRRISTELAVGDDAPSIGLVEPGYLYLAASDAGAQVLRAQHALQAEYAVHTALLDPTALAQRFPWLSTDGLTLGSLGLSTATSGEGWFDGYAAMQAFRRAAVASGVHFVEEEATGFTVDGQGSAVRVTEVTARSGRVFPCDAVVIAAGAWSAAVSAPLGVTLPVHARKRDVFAFEADVDLRDAPLLIDPSGMWFRPELQRGQFLCGAPPRGDDADEMPLDQVDHGLFDDVIWPALAARVPAFDRLKVTSSWAGYYEMNDFDHNGLVGRLAPYGNAYTACGFSGHGLQQAPAVGRGLAELIVTGQYLTLDLSPLRVDRIAEGRPLREQNVI